MWLQPIGWAIWIGGAAIMYLFWGNLPLHPPDDPRFDYVDAILFAILIAWGFGPFWLGALIDKAQLWLALHRRHY